MKTVVGSHREDSASLAAGYFTVVHGIETGERNPRTIKVRGDLNEVQALKAFTYSGPGTIEAYRRKGVTGPEAATRALTVTAGTAARLALDGGRETLVESTRATPQALGYARVTDVEPCAFCAMLASRGPVYHSEESALERVTETGDIDSYHNGCGCTVMPIYSKSDPWPGQARDFERLWAEATKGYSGRAAMNAFRRAYEAQGKAVQETATN